MLRRCLRRLRYWRRSGERARLLREEMEAHVAMKADELTEGGMAAEDAYDAARRQFGNAALHQEAARATWISRWFSDLVQDTVYAARTIGRQPGFAAVASVSAALGIGGCSLIFGLANQALFRPLPVEAPSRLVSISGKNLRSGKIGTSMTYPDFEDLRQAASLHGLTAFFPFVPATLSSEGEPRRYWGSLVTANYFDVIRPAFTIGRGFDPSRDDRPGEALVVVLSHNLWRTRFAAEPSIAGRVVEVNGRKATVVGVTGPGFRGTETMFYADFWLPFSALREMGYAGLSGERLHDRSSQWLSVTGRLREGAGVKSAAAEIEGIGQRLTAAWPATNRDRDFHLERAGQVNPGFRRMIVVFFLLLVGVTTLVLCTACANVANLLLARASARQREIATRLAIGAGRGRLIRQLLTESILLALIGGAGGFAIAQLGATAIGQSRIPLSMPVDLAVSLDYRVMLFCVALSALTGAIFGLVPALRATRPDLVSGLKDGRGTAGHSRRFGLRNLLVVAQVTICMVLLICSGLFVRSFYSAQAIDTGFSHRNLLLAGFDPSLNGYSPEQARRLAESMVERAGSLPGVESVTLANSIPLSLEGTQNSFVPEGDKTPVPADIYAVGPRFFETLGIRMLDGEDFRPGTAEETAIVNQALAARAFPEQNPVGRRISYQGRTVRIIGLVATAKSRTLGEAPHPCLYFPLIREVRGNDSLTGITLVLRTRGNPAGYATAVRETIRELDPALAVFDLRTMETQIEQALFVPRAAAYVFGIAGFVGLVIATIGIYGVISFGVARQTKEIGIRMALGAKRVQVVAMVLKEGMLLTVSGSILGLSLALALSRIAASLLYGVSPTDTLTFAVVPPMLASIAALACLIPARRAAALDPNRALRYE